MIFKSKRILWFTAIALLATCHLHTIKSKRDTKSTPTVQGQTQPISINQETITWLIQTGQTDLIKKYPTLWAHELMHIQQQKEEATSKTTPTKQPIFTKTPTYSPDTLDSEAIKQQ